MESFYRRDRSALDTRRASWCKFHNRRCLSDGSGPSSRKTSILSTSYTKPFYLSVHNVRSYCPFKSDARLQKYFGVFVSTGGLGGGQESSFIAALSSWVHQGMVYVPLGFAKAWDIMTTLKEVRGGSPWGAGTFAAGDGSRKPSESEIALAKAQGKAFLETLACVNFEAESKP